MLVSKMRRDASSLMLGITPLIWHGSVLTWQTKHKCLPPGLVKLLFHSHPAFPGAPVLVQRCSSTILRVLLPFLLTHCPVSSICRCHLVLRSLSAVPSLPTRSHSVLLTSRIRRDYASFRRQLNPAKTQFILFGSRHNPDQTAPDECRSLNKH